MTLTYKKIEEEQVLFLKHYGCNFIDTKTEYEHYRLTGEGITAIYYTSKKLVIQGAQAQLNKIENYLAREGLRAEQSKQKQEPQQNYEFNKEEHIGSDETLKGDTFGGLVVCAFHYKPAQEENLLRLGVKDSKSISDEDIKNIAEQLEEHYESCIESIELEPKEYNEKTQQENVTKILNETHKTLAKRLGNAKHIVDKYPGCTVGDVAITKGEEHSLGIAAASIIARAKALQQFQRLSQQAGSTLPKGSTHVKEALEKLKKEQADLSIFAKLHFKNVKEYI